MIMKSYKEHQSQAKTLVDKAIAGKKADSGRSGRAKARRQVSCPLRLISFSSHDIATSIQTVPQKDGAESKGTVVILGKGGLFG